MANEYVFLDLETTGLDENLGSVLELGIVVADINLQPIGSFQQILQFDDPRYEYENCGIDDFVIDMHTKNGLWDICAESYTVRATAELAALDFLADYSEPKIIELSGSTISFDRAWLKKHMPKLENWFHYRNIDVSSYKAMFKKYNLPERPVKAVGAHRAVSDCYDSIHDLRYYLQYLGVLPSE